MPTQLRVEPLEKRDVPVTFGTPWPDGQHLALSFAPDGTSILGAASNLGAALDPGAELAILRAFQTWATYANVNIGLVSDSGAAFGTGTGAQGDPRFGDIRVGGRPLAPDVLAITAPYQPSSAYSGEITLNTAANFGTGGYDLFTAVLQEVGHALGVGNSPDAASAMFEYYLGARTGLSADDVDAIRALYGARRADRFEGATGNDTRATATAYSGPLTADLTTATDADMFAFTAEPLTDRVTVRLRAAGLSLVTARVELLDASGRVLASGAAADPMQNDVTVSLSSVRPGQTYFVRVSGARADEFAVGSYELEIRQSSVAVPGPNDVLTTAQTRPGGGYHLADPRAGAAPVPELASGALDPGTSTTAPFALTQSGQVHLALTTTGAGGTAEAVVTDSAGHEVARFATAAWRPRALDLFLTAGTYTVTVRAVDGARIDFRLGMVLVTDPIGVRPEDPTSAPASTAPPPRSTPIAQAPQPPAAKLPTAPLSGSAALAPQPQLIQPAPPPPPPTGSATSGLLSPRLFAPPPTKSKTAPVEPIEYVWWY